MIARNPQQLVGSSFTDLLLASIQSKWLAHTTRRCIRSVTRAERDTAFLTGKVTITYTNMNTGATHRRVAQAGHHASNQSDRRCYVAGRLLTRTEFSCDRRTNRARRWNAISIHATREAFVPSLNYFRTLNGRFTQQSADLAPAEWAAFHESPAPALSQRAEKRCTSERFRYKAPASRPPYTLVTGPGSAVTLARRRRALLLEPALARELSLLSFASVALRVSYVPSPDRSTVLPCAPPGPYRPRAARQVKPELAR